MPKDLPIFVTGASGLIGSHVTSLLLSRDIPVRASFRTESEATQMTSVFTKLHPDASFTPVLIPDMKAPDAFNGAFAGCSAVAHVASDLSFSPDPNDVITGCVNAVLSVLKAAAAEPGVRRVVYTSSSNAATNPLVRRRKRKARTEGGEPGGADDDDADDKDAIKITSTSWNDAILETAWAPPPYLPLRAYAVYAASKVACERAAWDFIATQKPSFTLNTVLPNYTTGRILQPLSSPGAGSTARWVRDAFEQPFEEEYISKLRDQEAQWQVDVHDVARLHLAALMEEDVREERLLAFGERFNYGSWLRVFREMAPGESFRGKGRGMTTRGRRSGRRRWWRRGGVWNY